MATVSFRFPKKTRPTRQGYQAQKNERAKWIGHREDKVKYYHEQLFRSHQMLLMDCSLHSDLVPSTQVPRTAFSTMSKVPFVVSKEQRLGLVAFCGSTVSWGMVEITIIEDVTCSRTAEFAAYQAATLGHTRRISSTCHVGGSKGLKSHTHLRFEAASAAGIDP